MNINELKSDIRLEIKQQIEIIVAQERQELRQSLSTPFPPAASYGQPPHRRTGNLMNSSYVELEDNGVDLVITVGDSADYAGYLEDNHPFMSVAEERLTRALENL